MAADRGDVRRIVVVTSIVPSADAPHAGGRYLEEVCRLAERDSELTLIAPDTTVNRSVIDASADARPVVLVGGRSRRLGDRIRGRLAIRLDPVLRWIDQGAVFLPMRWGLRTSAAARAALAAADVVDLQWSDSIRLTRWVRRHAPRARLVGTFHDVQSQLFAREPSASRRGRAYWRWMARRARYVERRDVRLLDRVATFSDKDLRLLGSPANGVVIRPPIVGQAPHPRAGLGDGRTVLFVSYLARDENDKAAQWLVREIWPRVRDQVPDSRLRLVGAGATAALRGLAGEPIELAGFVDDLSAEYDAAGVVVVPLRQGAGVKFKTLEALLRAVPVVTTTVGAEGIGGADLFVALSDDAASLAAAIVAVLRDPAAHRDRSDRAAAWAREHYGQAQFEAAVEALWQIGSDH